MKKDLLIYWPNFLLFFLFLLFYCFKLATVAAMQMNKKLKSLDGNLKIVEFNVFDAKLKRKRKSSDSIL